MFPWLGIEILSARMRRQLFHSVSKLSNWLDASWKWLLLALMIGALPVVLDHLTGYHLSRWLTPVMVLPLLLAAVQRDSLYYAFLVLGGMLFSHSLTMIALAVHAPEHWSGIFPPGVQYWEVTREWLLTGESKEYQLSYWVPGHLQLAFAMVFYTYCSLGLITLWHGFHEVDLMNLYVSQLWLHSDGSLGVILLGWHPWSICRGIGFVVLTYELVSWSFEHLCGKTISTRRSRINRWGLGFGFLALDMVVKYTMLESVRQVLHQSIA